MIFIHSENYFLIVIYLADHPGGGGGYTLKVSHICANGQGFGPFRSENGYRLCPFWSGMGYGFRGNCGSVWTYLLFQFQVNKNEIETCEFEMHLKNFFVCAPIQEMMT